MGRKLKKKKHVQSFTSGDNLNSEHIILTILWFYVTSLCKNIFHQLESKRPWSLKSRYDLAPPSLLSKPNKGKPTYSGHGSSILHSAISNSPCPATLHRMLRLSASFCRWTHWFASIICYLVTSFLMFSYISVLCGISTSFGFFENFSLYLFETWGSRVPDVPLGESLFLALPNSIWSTDKTNRTTWQGVGSARGVLTPKEKTKKPKTKRKKEKKHLKIYLEIKKKKKKKNFVFFSQQLRFQPTTAWSLPFVDFVDAPRLARLNSSRPPKGVGRVATIYVFEAKKTKKKS